MPAPWLVPLIGAGASALGSMLAARQQQGFQERMSSTAHQRELKDLLAAGLNPAVGARMGGASTPGGAQMDLDPASAFWAGKLAKAQAYASESQGDAAVAQKMEVQRQTQLMHRMQNELEDRIRAEASSAGSAAREYRAIAESAELALPRQRAEAAMYRRMPWVVGAGPVGTAAGIVRDVVPLFRRRR